MILTETFFLFLSYLHILLVRSNGESWGSSRASTTIRSGRTCSPVPPLSRGSSHAKHDNGNDDNDHDSSPNSSNNNNNNNNNVGTAPSLFGGWFG